MSLIEPGERTAKGAPIGGAPACGWFLPSVVDEGCDGMLGAATAGSWKETE